MANIEYFTASKYQDKQNVLDYMGAYGMRLCKYNDRYYISYESAKAHLLEEWVAKTGYAFLMEPSVHSFKYVQEINIIKVIRDRRNILRYNPSQFANLPEAYEALEYLYNTFRLQDTSDF